MNRLQAYFLTGLLTLAPIWLVFIVFKFVFGLLSDISQPVIEPLTEHLAQAYPMMFAWLAQDWVKIAIGVAVTVAFILAIGFMTRRVIGQRLLIWIEALISKVPLANTVYGSARKLLDMLQTKPDGTQRVVLINFPHENMKSVGFVTRILQDEHTGEELAAVYVPTTPNPTSGYLEIVPVSQLIPTDWTADQAMSFIISGGAVAPDRIPFSLKK
ncbi:MAG TPA: DUF502 domain-containing protein [Arenimonas sp.]|nr:DUF502 domain-containing protein [Arenimonas sp.]